MEKLNPNSLLRDIYRLVLPQSVRNSRLVLSLKDRFISLVKRGNQRAFWHDTFYNDSYYEVVDKHAKESAPQIVSSILEAWSPRTVIDVGCGTGAMLDEFRKRGVTVSGLEYSESAVAICQRRSLPVRKFNIEKEQAGSEKFDVAISMEVAEHLSADFADRYVDILTSLSDKICLTAAPPGQGGLDHINEQPQEYWIEKFATRGFVHDLALSKKMSELWRQSGTVTWWYFQNVMVLQRQV